MRNFIILIAFWVISINAFSQGGAILAPETHQPGDPSTHPVVTSSIIPSVNNGAKRALDVEVQGSITNSEGNKTTTPLSNGSTFTGTGEIDKHSHFGISMKTDVDGILYTDFSNDGTNWDSTFPPAGFQVTGGIHEFHTGVKLGRYFRVRFLNDSGSDQSYIRLYTYYGDNFVPSNTPINQSVGIDNDASITRPNDFADEVVIGRRSGISPFTKFGYREGLTAASGEQTVWAASGNFTPLTTASTFTIAYNSSTDGDSTTGALTLYFQYVDSNGLKAESTHTLGATGSDVTSFSGLGINRIAVASSGSAQMNTNDITVTATTGGTTQAVIPALQSVTQQAIFFVDSNSFAVARFLWINTNKLSGGGTPRVQVKGYVFNRNVATRYEIFRVTIDTNSDTTKVINEPIGFRLTPSDVFYLVADTDTNNTDINARFSLREYKND